ncbi:hypothetical protein [Xanthobacter flavus]|uniref:hypothetical protein n=1 Tax=Xanthobacter flavus TaxID=281 RepID=UPI003726952B
MSLFQFGAYVDGWQKAQGGAAPSAPSDAEYDAMVAASDALDARAAARGGEVTNGDRA